MDTPVCQRWRDQRGVYRLAREPFDPRRCEVEETKSDNLARGFVEQHHYSGSYVAARFRFALHEAGALVGMAVFSTPMNDRSLAPFDRSEAVELGRLVLLDSVKANAESWFVARCFEQLRAKGLRGVVSFSDPEQRTDARGAVVLAGHIGTVYQGLNAIYKGRSKARVLRLLPDGTTLNERAMSKIRKQERGWRYAVDQLVEHGASAPEGDLDRWLPRALAQVTRPLRHGGNHRYLWALTPSHHARLLKRTDRLPYPKFSTLQGSP